MSFQGTMGRAATLVLLALAIGGCGGHHSSQAATPTPAFSEGSGTYTGTQTITITDTTTTAAIYYTTDGTTPTSTSTLYTAPIQVGVSLTLEAIAIASGNRDSAVASAAYAITPAAIPTAGIWYGTDAVGGQEVIALINSTGQSVFVRSDYSQYAGALTVKDATITATLAGYPNFPNTFPDGSISGSGAFSGTVTQATSITGTLNFLSSANTSYPGNYSLGYLNVSTSGSSLADVAGTYTDNAASEDPNTGGTVTISATGVLSSTGATSGCVMAGTISTADATTDVYEVAYSYTNCGGVFSPLNGLALSGLAALNTTLAPSQLLLAVNGPTGGASVYGLVSSLTLN
jgi:Chitobiase/beta-hexosaminidase C-terminal domain